MSSVQETSEGSPQSEYNARRQYVEQNIAEVFLELPLQKSVMTLVRRFNLEAVQGAFEHVESTSEDAESVPEIQENVPNVEAEDIPVHSPTALPTTVPVTTGSNSPRSSSVSNLVRSHSNEDITRESREIEFEAGPSETPYAPPLSEPAYKPTCSLNGEAVPRLDAKNLASIFDGADMKHSFEQMQGYSESTSVKSYQTHETTINALNFAENILHTMRERTLFKQKVAIIVLNPPDGKLLVNFLKKEGFQSARIKDEELNTASYDEMVEDNQAVVLDAESWNALEVKYKLMTPYLIFSFPEGEGNETTCGVQTLHVHTVERIPLVRKDLPMSCLSSVNPPPNIPHTPETGQSSSPAIGQPRSPAPFPRPQAPRAVPLPAINEELLFHANEPDSRLYYSLLNFARGVIRTLTNEIRSKLYPGFEELRNEYYKTSAFVNQLQCWISTADPHLPKPCYCLHLLKETHNALSLVYQLGAENVKYLIAPHIATIRERAQNGRPTGEDLDHIGSLEQILTDQLPERVNFEATEWFGRMVEELVEDVKSTRPFHGAVVVQARVSIWATYKLLQRHPELENAAFFPLYSRTPDPNAYDGDPGLRLSKTERTKRLQSFAQAEIGILVVAVHLDDRESALPVLDSVIVFGSTSDPTMGRAIPIKKSRFIKIGGSTPGSTYEVMQRASSD